MKDEDTSRLGKGGRRRNRVLYYSHLIPEPSTSKVTNLTSWKCVMGVSLSFDTKRAKNGCSRVGVAVLADEDDVIEISQCGGAISASLTRVNLHVYLEGSLHTNSYGSFIVWCIYSYTHHVST